MYISAQEFSEWKSQDVTKEFFKAINERIEDAKEILAADAGKDPDADNFFRGFIFAYRESLEFRVDNEEG